MWSFILREGDIDQRRTAGADKEQMQLGARIHRKIQRQMGSDYHAEVPLKMEVLCEGFTLCLEGRQMELLSGKMRLSLMRSKGSQRVKVYRGTSRSASGAG